MIELEGATGGNADGGPPVAERIEKSKPSWSDLSDAEVRGRLMRRGVEAVQAKGWVQSRMESWAIEEITAVLDQKYLDENDAEVRFEIPMDRRARR